ncbi:hypothetical protein [Nitratireductor soli]|uniref:hypothetical protein n=1 Tax=Nitratireductor soli TaxID=1670619 RepID=UPI00065E0DF1|nr:hypothetical protein [Nitratireductor soli]
MWKIHRAAQVAVTAGLFVALSGAAGLANDRAYIVNQNQTGITLPGVHSPNGFDEIRAADGTTCRAAMSGSGAFVDSGVIGGGLGTNSSSSLAAYGRLVIPLGQRPTRLNCDRLYQLELRRLQLEVKMLERGLDPRSSNSAPLNAEWAGSDEWSTGDRK